MSRPPKVGPYGTSGPTEALTPTAPSAGGEGIVPATITNAWLQLATALGQGLPHGINRAKDASRRLTRAVR